MQSINPGTGGPVLEMQSASLDFGRGAGVFDLTLSVLPGTILGVIGPSGCGKTTAVRLFTGIYRPSAGQVRVFGKNPAAFNDTDKTRIGYLPQHFILYPYLSAEENLHFMAGMYGLSPADRHPRLEALLDFMDLHEARHRLGRHLSGGMKRRLMLAGALLHDPELIFADEPTAGIDPILRSRIWHNFRALRGEGRTLVVTTQYVGEAAYCDCVAVLHKGRLVTVDSPDGLRRQAMGGEVIHLQIEIENLPKVIKFVEELHQVKKVELVEGERDGIYVYVENAGETLPALVMILRENLGITPKAARPYLPTFDEVFVRLVQNLDEWAGRTPWSIQEGEEGQYERDIGRSWSIKVANIYRQGKVLVPFMRARRWSSNKLYQMKEAEWSKKGVDLARSAQRQAGDQLGQAAQAVRAHMADTRRELEEATTTITMKAQRSDWFMRVWNNVQTGKTAAQNRLSEAVQAVRLHLDDTGREFKEIRMKIYLNSRQSEWLMRIWNIVQAGKTAVQAYLLELSQAARPRLANARRDANQILTQMSISVVALMNLEKPKADGQAPNETEIPFKLLPQTGQRNGRKPPKPARRRRLRRARNGMENGRVRWTKRSADLHSRFVIRSGRIRESKTGEKK